MSDQLDRVEMMLIYPIVELPVLHQAVESAIKRVESRKIFGCGLTIEHLVDGTTADSQVTVEVDFRLDGYGLRYLSAARL